MSRVPEMNIKNLPCLSNNVNLPKAHENEKKKVNGSSVDQCGEDHLLVPGQQNVRY